VDAVIAGVLFQCLHLPLFSVLINYHLLIGVTKGETKGPCPPIFRKYSHFVLWEAFF